MDNLSMDMKTLTATATILLNNLIAVLNNKDTKKTDFEAAITPLPSFIGPNRSFNQSGLTKSTASLGG